MLKVYIAKFSDGLRSPNYTWSNVRESICAYRLPEFFSVYSDGNSCEIHFDLELAYVAICLLQDIDSALRSYQFAYIGHFSFE